MVIYTASATYMAYGIAYFFIVIFQCGNPAQLFQNEVEGKCIPFSIVLPLGYIQAVLNAVTDWIFTVVPIVILWRTKMSLADKVSASICLALGGLSSVSSIARIGYVEGLQPDAAFFVNASEISIWSLVEPGLGIVAASLATLKPLCRNCLEYVRIIRRGLKFTVREDDVSSSVISGSSIKLQESGLCNKTSEKAGSQELEHQLCRGLQLKAVTTIFPMKCGPGVVGPSCHYTLSEDAGQSMVGA